MILAFRGQESDSAPEVPPTFRSFVVLVLLALTSTQQAVGQSSQDRPRFSGPDSVDRQLETDAEPGQPLFRPDFLQSYFDFKGNLTEKTGLNFGVDYSGIYLWASESLTHEQAGGGMVRLYGTWDLVGRASENTGTFIYKVEHRHRYSTIPAADLGFDLGYVGLFNPPFSDQRWRVTNLFWKQRLLEGRLGFTAGFLDATDYVDIYALGSPWLHFSNFVFSTGSAAISLPEDAAFGFGAGGFITDKLYILAGLTDTNSDPTDPFQGFDTFFSDHEFFKSLEVGLTTSRERAYLDNIHVTLWHADKREEAQVEEGWGAAFSFTLWATDTWMPFLRGGFAKDGGSLLQKSISTGFGYQRIAGRDLLGVGFNWGEPHESFGAGLDDQYSLELFYRWQLTRELAITPDLQLLINPALNPDQNSIWVFGLRARLAF